MRSLLSAAVVLCAACFSPVEQGNGLTSSTQTGSQGGALWVAFDSDRGTVDRDVYAIRPDGTDLRRLTNHPGTDKHPAFSPDGQKLAFVSDRGGALDLHLMNLADGSVTQLTNRGAVGYPSWSADGRSIVVVAGGGIFTVDVQSGALRHVTTVTTGLSGGGWRFPSFSPDGQTIAADATYALYSVDANGGDAALLIPNTAASEVHPSYSPSGAHIVFSQYVGNGVDALFIMPARGLDERASNPGSGAKRLTADGAPTSTNPSWGSDGRVVYEQGKIDADLMLVSETGGASTALTSGAGDDRNPVWSPAGALMPASL